MICDYFTLKFANLSSSFTTQRELVLILLTDEHESKKENDHSYA